MKNYYDFEFVDNNWLNDFLNNLEEDGVKYKPVHFFRSKGRRCVKLCYDEKYEHRIFDRYEEYVGDYYGRPVKDD